MSVDKPRPCHMTAVAREQHGLPDDWVWVSFDAHDQPEDFIKMRGGVYEPMTSGKRKGKPNWKKPLPGTERTVFIRFRDIGAWELRQEQLTGECMTCDGTGQEWAGFSVGEGSRYRECRKCSGSGNATAIPITATA